MNYTSDNFVHYQNSDKSEIDFSDQPSALINETAMQLLRKITREDRQFQFQEGQS